VSSRPADSVGDSERRGTCKSGALPSGSLDGTQGSHRCSRKGSEARGDHHPGSFANEGRHCVAQFDARRREFDAFEALSRYIMAVHRYRETM